MKNELSEHSITLDAMTPEQVSEQIWDEHVSYKTVASRRIMPAITAALTAAHEAALEAAAVACKDIANKAMQRSWEDMQRGMTFVEGAEACEAIVRSMKGKP